MRLYHLEEYLNEEWDDYMLSLLNNYKVPINYDRTNFVGLSDKEPSKDMATPEKTNVTSNILREFLSESSFLEIQPPLPRLESSLKGAFLASLTHMHSFDKLQVLEIVRDHVKFDFSDLKPQVLSSINLLDELLSEAFLPLIGLLAFLQSFEHLVVSDERKLLEEEIALLEKQNTFDALETEVRLLHSDQDLIEKVPDSVWLGIFEVDLREFKSGLLSKISKCVEEVFVSTIYNKFLELLESNKLAFEHLVHNLITPIDSVDNFIKQKEFLSGVDFQEHLEAITRDLQLTKSMFEFQLEFLRMIDKPDAEKYLKSLGYLKELEYLRDDVLDRLADSGPKFVTELGNAGLLVFQDLEKVQKEIKCFPYYCDIESADIYYEKTLDVNKQLESMQSRAQDINRKQSVLDTSLTNFDSIDQEIRGFSKYTQLWEFIAFKWAPAVERWWKGYFQDLNKFEMSATLNYGAELLKRLYDEFVDGPKIQEIIKSKQTDIERHQNIYNHIVILKDPSFKERHWEAFFNEVKQEDKGSGILQTKIDLKKLTLNDLMEMHLTSHTNFLKQILIKARAEAVIEQSIIDTKENIRKIVIKPRIFDNDNNGIMVISNINNILTALEEHLSVCQNMLSNPEYPEEFKRELRNLVRLVGFTTEIIRLIQRVQNKLIKFAPVFKFRDITRYVARTDIVNVFGRVRQEYMEVMRSIHLKEMGYFVLLVGEDNDDTKPNEVIKRLRDMNRQCEEILESLNGFFRLVRLECPRYYFFSNEQMLLLCSLLKFPKSLFGLIITLFKGVSTVELSGNGNDLADADQLSINKLKTKCSEVIKFPVPPNIDLSPTGQIPFLSIVSAIERSIKRYMYTSRNQHILAIANFQFDFASMLKYCRDNEVILQNVRLFVRLIFDFELVSVLKLADGQNPPINPQQRFKLLKSRVLEGLQQLFDYPSKFLHGNYANKAVIYFWNNYIMIVRQLEETLEYLLRREVTDISSFEFQSLPKYSMSLPKNQMDEGTLKSKLTEYFSGLSEVLDDRSPVLEGKHPQNLHPKLSDHSLVVTLASGIQLVKESFANEKHLVSLNVLEYSLEYCDEIVADSQSLVEFPITEKRVFYLLTSVANNNLVILKGLSGIGKNSSVRILAQMLGKNHYEYDCAANETAELVPAFIVGAVNGGFWFTFKKLDACPTSVLSVILTFLDTIKSALPGVGKRTIDSYTLKPSPGFAIFTTYRLSAGESMCKFSELPINLLELFRVVRLSSPCLVGIVSGLLSPVMSLAHSFEWASKLSFFVKTFSKIDYADQPGSKIALLAQESIAGADSGSSQTTKTILTLKVVCNLMTVSTAKLYSYLGRQYEKYRDSETGKFRIDINKIKVLSDKDRRAVFTRLFIDSLTEYFSRAEISRTHVTGIVDLLSKTFQLELESFKSSSQSALTAPVDKKFREKIMESLNDYKEQNRDVKLLNSQKLIAKTEPFINLVLGSEEDRSTHFLVYGKPDSQKSMLIDLLAFVYSDMYHINFKKFWLILESLTHDTIFGTGKSPGIFAEIFNQSHNLDLEDKTNQPKKINYLFQSNSDLYFTLADGREQKKSKPNSNQSVSFKEMSRAHTWVVIDANSSKNNAKTSKTVEKIFGMFSALYSFKDINKHVGFSPQTKVFYELNTISMLNSSILTDLKLIFLETPLFENKDRVNIWLDKLALQDGWFQTMSSRIQELIKGILLPFVEFLDSIVVQNPEILTYSTSATSMLNSVLNLLSIFLNEFRKYHLIHDFEGLKSKPDLFANCKAEAQQSPGKISNSSAWKVLGNLNNQMKLAQQAQSFNRIQSRSAGLSPVLAAKSHASINTNHYLFGLDSPEEIEEWENRRLEALVVFATIFGLNSFVSEFRKPQVFRVFDEGIGRFAKKQKIHKSAFACGYLSLSETKRTPHMTDYCFDVTKGTWLRWIDVKIRSINEISPSYSNKNFSRMELERLNCQNTKLLNFTEITEGGSTLETLVGLKDKSLYVGSEGNMLSYFSEYLISYGLHFTVVSDYQQGKSTLIQSILRKIIEQNRIVTFNYQLDRSSDSKSIQSRIEGSLLKEVGNVLRPGKNKIAVVWLDDIHLGSDWCKPESLARSLQTQNGWFSLSTMNFYKVVNTVFLLSLSLRENETFAARETMSSVNIDSVAKSPVLRMRRISKEEFSSIFFEVVNSQIVSTPTSSKKGEEGLTASITKQLVSLLYDAQSQIAEATSSRSLQLGMENFLQLARTVNNISWKDVNKDKKSVQWVWIWLMRDFFTAELGMQQCEIKALLAGNGDLMQASPSPALLAKDFKSSKLKQMLPVNTGLFLTDRRASDRNINTRETQEEEVVRRLRAGSAAVDFEEPDQPVSPFTVQSHQKQRFKMMQNEVMSSDRESEGGEDDFFFADKHEKMQVSPLPQPSKFRKQALNLGSQQVSEKSIRLQQSSNQSDNESHQETQSLDQMSAPQVPAFPIIISPQKDSADESRSVDQDSEQGPSIAENSEESQKNEGSPNPRGKSKFFEAAASSRPKIQLISADTIHKFGELKEPNSLRPSIMESVSKGNPASSRKQSQLFPGGKKSVYGGDSEDELKPLTVRADDSSSDSDQSSSGESPEYVFRDPNSQRISAFSFSKRDRRKKKDKNLQDPNASPRGSGMFGQLPDEASRISKNMAKGQSPKASPQKKPRNSLASFSQDSDPAGKTVKLKQISSEAFFDEVISKLFDKQSNKPHVVDRLKYSVYTSKLLFFDTAVHEAGLGEEMEKDYDLIHHSFEVLMSKGSQVLLGFLKSGIQGYVTSNPEGALSFSLENFQSQQFLADFTSLHLAIHTEFQHLLINCIKTGLYVKHLIGLICESVGDSFFFFDVTQDNSRSLKEAEVTQDTFRSIKNTLKENFERIVKNNKRLVFVLSFGPLNSEERKSVACQLFDFVSAIIFNTDNLLSILDEQLFDHVAQIKKHRISSHYEDFFATYLVRNKLESRVTFVLLSEQQSESVTSKRARFLAPAPATSLPSFLQQNYPKLFLRMKKMLFNGLKITTQHEPGQLIGPPNNPALMPWTARDIPVIFKKSTTLELTFLKNEKDLGGLQLLRGYQESLHLFTYVKSVLLRRIQGKQGDSEHVERDQKLLLDRIARRKEILRIEIDKLLSDEAQLKEELNMLSSARVSVDKSIEQLRSDREKLKILLVNHKEKVDLCRKELEKIVQYDKDLKDVQETILGFQETELQKQLAFGGFFHSPVFTIYAVLFNDLFNMPVEPKLTMPSLVGLANTGQAKRFMAHAKFLSKLLEDPAKSLLPLVRDPPTNMEATTPERLITMHKIVKKMEDEGVIKRFNEAQKLFLIWIDFIIQLKVQENKKPELDQLGQKSQVALADTVLQIEQHTKLLADLETSAREQIRKKQNHEALMEGIAEKIKHKKDSLAILSRFLESLTLAQSLYVKMISPFLSYGLDRAKTIDLVTSYLVFWNKYPSLTKKILFYSLLQVTEINPEIFNEVAIYEFLNPELPLVAALQSKIPFNQNMLNNVSILNFAHEAMLPYCLVKDSSGSILKWLEYNFTRFIYIDQSCPSAKTVENLEVCMTNGQPYIALDPNDELVRLISPILEWRYRRYAEQVLATRDYPLSPSVEIKFNQKKLIVKDGFRIILILQKTMLERIDPSLLAITLLLNNELNDKKISSDMLTEELILMLEPNKREQCIKSFVETDLRSQIYEKYNEMTAKISLFDFIIDDVSSGDFKRIELLLNEVIQASNQQLASLSKKKQLLENAAKALSTRNSIFMGEMDRDSKAENFMSSALTLGIKDYKTLEDKYIALSERLRVYQIANDKIRAFIGDEFSLGPDLFSYLLAESVSMHKKEIEQVAANQEGFELLLTKIERTLFNQLVTNTPEPSRFIYTFLCGVITLLTHSQAKKSLMKSLYLLLYSEKLLPKEGKNISFVSDKMYERLNRLYQGIKGHFIYSSHNLPSLMAIDQDFDSLFAQVKNLDKLDLSDLEQIRKTDKARLQAISALMAEGREVRTSTQEWSLESPFKLKMDSSKDEPDYSPEMQTSQMENAVSLEQRHSMARRLQVALQRVQRRRLGVGREVDRDPDRVQLLSFQLHAAGQLSP